MSDNAIRHSVTADDVIPTQAGTGFVPTTVWLGPLGLLSEIPGLSQSSTTGLPPQGTTARDMVLSLTPTFETMWADVVGRAVQKQVALGFRLDDSGDSARRISSSQEMILRYGGQYFTGQQQGLQDFLLTNLGQVIEIATASNARGARPVGLFHLDSLRCIRTADPAYPIIYQDTRGKYHRLPEERVIVLTDMPSSRVEMRGYGMCAADRAWAAILKLSAIEIYFREKITGSRNLAIHILTGVTDKQVRAALATGDDEVETRGFLLYRGSTIMTATSAEPKLITIDLASVPDGFDAEQERKDGHRKYAHAVGINVDEIVERAAGLNSGLSAAVNAQAADGVGLASWRRAFEQAISHKFLPSKTTFYFTTPDIQDKKAEAEVAKIRADTRKVQIESGELTVQQAQNMAADIGDIPPEFLSNDQTLGGTVTDTGKVVDQTQTEVAAIETAQPAITKEKNPFARIRTILKDKEGSAKRAEREAEALLASVGETALRWAALIDE